MDINFNVGSITTRPVVPVQSAMQEALSSVRLGPEQQGRFVSMESNLQQADQFFASQLATLARTQVCMVPFWTNIEEVRRKSIKRINDERSSRKNPSAVDGKEIAVVEVGFTSGMLSLFLNSPAQQRETLRRVQKFAQMLSERHAEGGVYFLDETQAAIWTHSDGSAPETDIHIQFLHPQALFVGAPLQNASAYRPAMHIQSKATHPPAFLKTPSGAALHVASVRYATQKQRPPSSASCGEPRKGFFRSYED